LHAKGTPVRSSPANVTKADYLLDELDICQLLTEAKRLFLSAADDY
jgi:hypothetical protein